MPTPHSAYLCTLLNSAEGPVIALIFLGSLTDPRTSLIYFAPAWFEFSSTQLSLLHSLFHQLWSPIPRNKAICSFANNHIKELETYNLLQ